MEIGAAWTHVLAVWIDQSALQWGQTPERLEVARLGLKLGTNGLLERHHWLVRHLPVPRLFTRPRMLAIRQMVHGPAPPQDV